MKRRDVLKAGMIITGALGASAFCGCSNDRVQNSFGENLVIKPKQTAMYKFSFPLPFNFALIDELAKLNKTLKNTKIATFYNSIPLPCAKDLVDFQSPRGTNENIKSFDDFMKYVKYAKEKGFDFVYTLNSPKPFIESEFSEKSKVLNPLLDNLKKNGLKKIKVANTQVLNFLQQNHPEFKLSASTSFEFHTLRQYINLIEKYPNIKSINIALDENRNFKLLKSLKEKFPKIKFELMVNETCLYGCPARISHPCSGVEACEYIDLIKKDDYISIYQARNIYPWDLGYYSAIGINNFKFMKGSRANLTKIDFATLYINIVENGIGNYSAFEFLKCFLKGKCPDIKNQNILLADVIKYFPDMKHFVKYGHNCADICSVKCNYCHSHAQKLAKILS